MADNPTGHALDPVARVQALGCQVAAVQAARGGHEDVGRGGSRVAPVHKPEGVWGSGLGAIIGGELGDGDLAEAAPARGGGLRGTRPGGAQAGAGSLQGEYLGV